jgi:hypothetical protein
MRRGVLWLLLEHAHDPAHEKHLHWVRLSACDDFRPPLIRMKP